MTDKPESGEVAALIEQRAKVESLVGLSRLPELQKAWCDYTDMLDALARAQLAKPPSGEVAALLSEPEYESPEDAATRVVAKVMAEHGDDLVKALAATPLASAIDAGDLSGPSQEGADGTAAAPIAAPAEPPKDGEVAALIERRATLFEAIAHGDAEHRAWLKQAIDAHFRGDPIPLARLSAPVPDKEK